MAYYYYYYSNVCLVSLLPIFPYSFSSFVLIKLHRIPSANILPYWAQQQNQKRRSTVKAIKMRLTAHTKMYIFFDYFGLANIQLPIASEPHTKRRKREETQMKSDLWNANILYFVTLLCRECVIGDRQQKFSFRSSKTRSSFNGHEQRKKEPTFVDQIIK